MLYLRHLLLCSPLQEEACLANASDSYYDTFYPFQIFPRKELHRLDFEPITIFCGGNGSGKTTALNITAELLRAHRNAPHNSSDYFPHYVDCCTPDFTGECYERAEIITSDDVFDYVINLRNMNRGVSRLRQGLQTEYAQTARNKDFHLMSIDDYEELKKRNEVKRSSMASFVKRRSNRRVRESSNGESAFRYFVEKLRDGGLYLLDEPENSLSPKRQQELVQLIEDCARFYDCQFIIATHSPFFLSLKSARIYDFDACPVTTKRWTDFDTVRDYFNFFKQHESEFET